MYRSKRASTRPSRRRFPVSVSTLSMSSRMMNCSIPVVIDKRLVRSSNSLVFINDRTGSKASANAVFSELACRYLTASCSKLLTSCHSENTNAFSFLDGYFSTTFASAAWSFPQQSLRRRLSFLGDFLRQQWSLLRQFLRLRSLRQRRSLRLFAPLLQLLLIVIIVATFL